MERTLAAFSAVILLIGCFTGCGSGEKPSDRRLPAVIFIYSLYGQGSAERRFCDSEGNYYLVLKEELCYLSFAELADKYSSGDIDSDIKLLRICNKGGLEKIYQKLLRASAAKDKGLEMNYINTIKMVDTYLPYYDMELQKAEDKQIPENLAAIKASVNSRENFIRPVSEQEKMFCEGYYRFSGRDRVHPTFTRSEKIVYSTDECIGCGICNSVCPHGSWKIVNGKSVAEGDCENCLACVHNCPTKAISIIPTPPEPEEPNRKSRYRNPNVRVGEIILANSQVNYNG